MGPITAAKDAVFQAIRRDYRIRQVSLQRDIERREELRAKLVQCDDEILRVRQALAQLSAFANAMGWTEKDMT